MLTGKPINVFFFLIYLQTEYRRVYFNSEILSKFLQHSVTTRYYFETNLLTFFSCFMTLILFLTLANGGSRKEMTYMTSRLLAHVTKEGHFV